MADQPGEADRHHATGVTALADYLRAEIRRQGPIGIDRFMADALGHPVHGYYLTRDPLGAGGDFTTSPEISQVFGEIIGFYLANQWLALGSPDHVQLVELGPGRGTLMADLLRALRLLPACRAAVTLHMVETSPVLREAQRVTLARRHPDITPIWHDRFETVPAGPLLLVANEFFDALPIRQFRFEPTGWREIMVDLDSSGSFVFTGANIAAPVLPAAAEAGDIAEICEAGLAIAAQIGARLATTPGCAVMIDYGHLQGGFGDTLQAMKKHRYAPVLESPGEADLTAHVDFQALAAALTSAGAEIALKTTQAQFLLDNGVALRDQALTRNKSADEAAAIRTGIQRLIDPAGMGTLFKVMVANSPKMSRNAQV